jgi:hypothetical protein
MVMTFTFHLGLRHFEPARGSAANFVFSTYLAARYGQSRDDEENTKKEQLSNILSRSRNHLATDPRDRIFAFLAMVNSWRLDEKYDSHCKLLIEEVYVKFARLIIDDGHL